MPKYVLQFVNFIRNVRLSDQVFRIGSKKTVRHVEVAIFIIIIIIVIITSIIIIIIIVINISIFIIVIIMIIEITISSIVIGFRNSENSLLSGSSVSQSHSKV